jgi:hypothetical protein
MRTLPAASNSDRQRSIHGIPGARSQLALGSGRHDTPMSAFQAGEHRDFRQPTVDIAVPIYNESGDLEASVRRLRDYLDHQFPFRAVITIVDNASTDRSWEIATSLASTVPGVRALHLDLKGRGRALRTVWSASDAEVVAYMDVDLSTGLDALLPLIAPLLSGHSDVAIGSRLAHGARVLRGPKREVISRLYNTILRVALHSRSSDAQCGFKAMRATDARAVLPLVVDNEWFFDTELLVVAERAGLRISEVPVDWSDDPDSSVHLATTARKDLQGVWRMLRTSRRDIGAVRAIRPPHLAAPLDELVDASRLGITGMTTYVVLLLLSAQFMTLSVANLVALCLATAVRTAGASRPARETGPPVAAWPRVAGVGLIVVTSAVATTVVWGVAVLMGTGSLVAGLAATTIGMSVASAARFISCRALVFRAYLGQIPLPTDSLRSHPVTGSDRHGTIALFGDRPNPPASQIVVLPQVEESELSRR